MSDIEKWREFLAAQGVEFEDERDDDGATGLRLLETNGKVSSFCGLGMLIQFEPDGRLCFLAPDV